MAQDNDSQDSQTEDESDEGWDSRRRRRANLLDNNEDEDDDSDNDEPLPPLPPPLPQSRIPPGSSRGRAAMKDLRPKPTLPTSKTTLSTRPLPRTTTKPIASTSSSHPPTAPFSSDAATYVAHPPPPQDLNDTNALVAWALRIATQQSRGFDADLGSTSNQPIQRTTTADHVARAIAARRSQPNGTNQPHPQGTQSRPSQASSIGVTPSTSVPSSNNSSSPNAGVASG